MALSTCIGVGGCLRPISSNAMRIGTAILAARKVALTSASMAELITVLIFFARTWTTLFGFGVFVGVVPGSCGWELRKKTAPALLLSLSSDNKRHQLLTTGPCRFCGI